MNKSIKKALLRISPELSSNALLSYIILWWSPLEMESMEFYWTEYTDQINYQSIRVS